MTPVASESVFMFNYGSRTITDMEFLGESIHFETPREA
jgi:hypothetical protein